MPLIAPHPHLTPLTEDIPRRMLADSTADRERSTPLAGDDNDPVLRLSPVTFHSASERPDTAAPNPTHHTNSLLRGGE